MSVPCRLRIVVGCDTHWGAMSFQSITRASLSGVRVEETRLAVSATNVANVNTPGFRSGRVASEDLPGGGAAVIVRWSSAIPPVEPGVETPSNTELATEFVDQQGALAGVRANVAVLRATHEAEKSLLDVLA